MKKCILYVLACLFFLHNAAQAQTLFIAPDTVCVRQQLHLNSTIFGAANYYWGFCSGDLINPPVGSNMRNRFNFKDAANIEIVKDHDGLYYGFVVNAATDEFMRLNFGTSLNNTPTVTNMGNLTNGLPHHPTSLFILYDKTYGNWHVFVSGGYNRAESNLARIDFGASLSNSAPNIARFGNFGNILNGPKGIFVAQEPTDNKWYGFVVNRFNSRLIRLDFGLNVSNTPIYTDLGNPTDAVTSLPVLNLPTDAAGILDRGNWFLFVTNRGNNTVARIQIGSTLFTIPPNTGAGTARNLGDFNFRVIEPSSISLTRDCNDLVAYITDSTTSQLVKISSNSAAGVFTPVTYSVIGGMNFPDCITSVIRDVDDLYAFVTNHGDSSLTKLLINHCTNSTIPSFTEVTPPPYFYTTPGLYNVYYVVNQGLPTMRSECKQIRVLPIPNIFMNQDTTICLNDTIQLHAISNYADSFVWNPVYNIDTAYNHNDTVRVWPRYSYAYGLWIRYPDGCTVDTVIRVKVIKVVADAGPDRTILDGATTTLGGPNTTLTGNVGYQWSPNFYLGNATTPYTHANPHSDISYVLQVTLLDDRFTCRAYDTVVVHVNCGDIYLPNVFRPGSDVAANKKFGIQNVMLTHLNYFRIFDRWGNMVFQTTNPAEAWDGTYLTEPMPQGVYTWIADGYCDSGKPVKKAGNVTLMR